MEGSDRAGPGWRRPGAERGRRPWHRARRRSVRPHGRTAPIARCRRRPAERTVSSTKVARGDRCSGAPRRGPTLRRAGARRGGRRRRAGGQGAAGEAPCLTPHETTHAAKSPCSSEASRETNNTVTQSPLDAVLSQDRGGAREAALGCRQRRLGRGPHLDTLRREPLGREPAPLPYRFRALHELVVRLDPRREAAAEAIAAGLRRPRRAIPLLATTPGGTQGQSAAPRICTKLYQDRCEPRCANGVRRVLTPSARSA